MAINPIISDDVLRIDYLYDKNTGAFSYILIDKETEDCAIIDPILNYDADTAAVSTQLADEIIDYITKRYLNLKWILETNIHIDHLSAASYIKSKLGGRIAISDFVLELPKTWSPIFNSTKNISFDGSQFDYLFGDGEKFFVGNFEVKTIHSPGYTPFCSCFLIKDYIFAGDTILSPELGTSRTDLLGSDSKALFESIQNLLALPDQTKFLLGHDFPQQGKQAQFSFNILEQKKYNILVKSDLTLEKYLELRDKKNLENPLPSLLLPAIYFNLSLGKIVPSEVSVNQHATILLKKIT